MERYTNSYGRPDFAPDAPCEPIERTRSSAARSSWESEQHREDRVQEIRHHAEQKFHDLQAKAGRKLDELKDVANHKATELKSEGRTRLMDAKAEGRSAIRKSKSFMRENPGIIAAAATAAGITAGLVARRLLRRSKPLGVLVVEEHRVIG